MTRHVLFRALGVTASVAGLLLAHPASSAAQVTAPSPAPIPPAPRRDSVLAVMPLRVTTPAPSTVRPTGVQSNFRTVAAAGPVAMVSPSPPPSTIRVVTPTAVAGPPAPTPFERPVPSSIAASAVTPAQRIASAAPTPPAGATMRCKDGTFLSGATSEQRCAGNGGLGVTFQAAPAVPQPPVRRP